jgi:hypothetical protein
MADTRLADILDDCINRLNRGETVADCLRAYPDHQRQLLPMLEAGRLARRLTLSVTTTEAQARIGMRFEQALRQPHSGFGRNAGSLGLMTWAAIFILLIGLFGGSLLALSQTAIPGDTLYGVKQWSETTALALTNNSPTLQEQFAQRRVQETQQIVTLKRPADVTFGGTIEQVGETTIVIQGLTVRIPIDTPVLAPGMRVEIAARTDTNGDIFALTIREARQLEASSVEPLPTITVSATPTYTLTPPTPSMTPMPNLSSISTVSIPNDPVPTATLPAPAVFPPPTQNQPLVPLPSCAPNMPCEPRIDVTRLPVCAPGIPTPCRPNPANQNQNNPNLPPCQPSGTPFPCAPVPPHNNPLRCNLNGTPAPCPPQTNPTPPRPTLTPFPTVTLRPFNTPPNAPLCNLNGTPAPCPPRPLQTNLTPSRPTLTPPVDEKPALPCGVQQPCPPPNPEGNMPSHPENPLPPMPNPPEGNPQPPIPPPNNIRPPDVTPPTPSPRPGNNG